jgi:uncharacterized membrane protein YwzB
MIAGQFAAIAITLYAVHLVADYWAQGTRISAGKLRPGLDGHSWCLLHVLIHATGTIGALWALQAWRITWITDGPRGYLGVALIAVTHYIADRRTLLRRIAIATDHTPEWLDRGGLAQLDQAWHIAWLVAASLLIAS